MGPVGLVAVECIVIFSCDRLLFRSDGCGSQGRADSPHKGDKYFFKCSSEKLHSSTCLATGVVEDSF